MSVLNVQPVMNMLQGIVAAEFNNTRHNQGASLFPQLILPILSRGDLAHSLNARVSLPALFDGTNDEDVDGVANLVGFIADNTEAAINTLVWYNTATPTEGTTVPLAVWEIPASTMVTVVIPDPLVFDTALTFSVLDGSALTNSTTLGAASSVDVTAVYTE